MESNNPLVVMQRHIDKMEKEIRRLGSMKFRQFNALFGLAGSGHVIIGVGGIQIMQGTTVMGEWQTDGDIFIGSNIAFPASTYFSILATAQTYNTEVFEAGDMLIGDNSASKANIFWDKSAGRLNFRGGTTVGVYIDTTGALTAGGGNVMLDANGISIVMATVDTSDPTSVPNIIKWTVSGTQQAYLYGYRLVASDTVFGGFTVSGYSGELEADMLLSVNDFGSTETASIRLRSSGDTLGESQIDITSDNLNLTVGGTIQFISGNIITIEGGVVINSLGADVDFRVESDLQTHSLFVQGSDGFAGINNNAPSAQLDVVGSAEITLGLNIGSATSAATGEARASVGFSARVDGSGGGLYAGAASDVQFYRSGANVWRTPDSLTVDGNFIASGNASVAGLFNLPRSTLTISGGIVTVTQSCHLIDTEGGAATDNLDTINGGTDGDILILRSANAARDTTVKDGTGNLNIAGDFTFTTPTDVIMLIYNGATWFEISRSDNS